MIDHLDEIELKVLRETNKRLEAELKEYKSWANGRRPEKHIERQKKLEKDLSTANAEMARLRGEINDLTVCRNHWKLSFETEKAENERLNAERRG